MDVKQKSKQKVFPDIVTGDVVFTSPTVEVKITQPPERIVIDDTENFLLKGECNGEPMTLVGFSDTLIDVMI
ncbi:TPA: hypothetical protein M2O72_000587 [Klebsiella pneumoniae]|nr:hypothetical protein [Klebsiella pneumoniae]